MLCQFLALNEDDKILDEDAKEGGAQLEKYKLKLVKDNVVQENSSDTIDKAYKLETFSSYYATQLDEKRPYLIFDWESRLNHSLQYFVQGKRY